MRFISLRTKLIVASLCFVLLPIFGIGGYSYNEFEHILNDKIARTASDSLHQVNMNIVQELSMMVNAASSIILDDQVRNVLNTPPNTYRQKLDNVNQIDKKFLEISTAILTDSITLTLFDKYGNVYTNWGQTVESLEQISRSDWFQHANNEKGYMVWELNHDSYVKPVPEKMTTLAMAIRDKDLKNEIGMLIISRPAQHFLRILAAKNERSLGFIIDGNGNLLGEIPERVRDMYPLMASKMTRDENHFTMEVNGETFEVIANTVPFTDWKIIQMMSHSDIYKPVVQIRSVVLVLLMISMIIFITIIVLISSMLTKPLRKLGKLMKQVELGRLDVAFTVRSRDEVGLLGKTFNHMLIKLRDHLDKEITLERSKKLAKLEALQAQINPHFLHNTLNTIKWMSIMAGTKEITEMLLSLGNLLNMSINRGQEAIRLKEEIENVRYFLTIQKYRFGDTIEVVEAFEPETLEGYVPKLSLQPLVENVYQHGLFIDGGRMTLSSNRMGDELLLKVTDTGSAPDPERMKVIAERLSKQTQGSFSGIGIANVHRRIQLMFGPRYGLQFERDEHKGTTYFTIHIPFRRDWNESSSSSD